MLIKNNKHFTDAIALGCSHTLGTGVKEHECYVSVLQQKTGISIKNLGVGGGNAQVVQSNLIHEIRYHRPRFVLAQWPNPIRTTLWTDDEPRMENINSFSPAFELLLQQSKENFIQPWLSTIITCNLLCQLAEVPILNLLFEDIDKTYNQVLKDNHITLHQDEKLPGRAWFFDSGGSDGRHHSAQCHRQWAERILNLLNEHVT